MASETGHHTDFVVESFDRGAGKLAFGAEPVEPQFVMIVQQARNFPYRFEAAALGAVALGIQKARRPERRLISPEVTGRLLQRPK